MRWIVYVPPQCSPTLYQFSLPSSCLPFTECDFSWSLALSCHWLYCVHCDGGWIDCSVINMVIELAEHSQISVICLSWILLMSSADFHEYCWCLLQATGNAFGILAHQAVHPPGPHATDAAFHETRRWCSQAWSDHPDLDFPQCQQL